VYARHIPLFNDPLGVQALKTGFTLEAGYNMAVSAWRDGQQFVMIVLGSRTRALSFLDAKKLLKYSFVETGLDSPPERRTTRHKPARTRRTTLTQGARSEATSSTRTARSSTSTRSPKPGARSRATRRPCRPPGARNNWSIRG